MIQRLTIIGVGLIGGSFALALKSAGAVQNVVGSGRNIENLKKAVQLGVVDRYYTDPLSAVRGAELVMLAVPMGAMGPLMAQIRDALEPQAILTDAGSVKGSFVRDAREALTDLRRVVPGHPIAGTEHSGVEAAFANLYHGRRVILTPTDETDPDAVERVRKLWEATGAVVELLDVARHDRVLAATSHLPHLLAFGLVDALAKRESREDIFRFAAGGFRDFTRIASSNPEMWRDICLANKEALLEVMADYQQNIEVLMGLVRDGKGEGLAAVFERAKKARDQFVG